MGYRDEEIDNRFEDWESRLHPDDREAILSALKDYLAGKRVEYALELRLRHKDGSYRWVYTRADKEVDEDGKATRLYGCNVDVTERKDAQFALEKSEERYRTLFERSQNGIIFADSATQRFKYANPAAARMLGYTIEELCSLSVEDIHPAEAHDRVRREFEEQFEGRKTIANDLPCLRKDGTVIYADVSGGSFTTSEGTFSIGFFIDTTERRQAEERFQEYQQQLKALTSQLTIAEERERRRIAAELHDDVGQNLALARLQLASANKATEDPKLLAKLQGLSETLLKATQDTRHLVYDLTSPALRELGLSEAIAEWLEEEIGNRQGLETSFVSDGDACPLGEDVMALLFRNVRELLTNVVKHAHAERVSVELAHVGGDIQLVIKDNGVGFNAKEQAFRAHSHGGFGLFSIRERMVNMGGRFVLESEPERGCRAELSVPCCPATTEPDGDSNQR